MLCALRGGSLPASLPVVVTEPLEADLVRLTECLTARLCQMCQVPPADGIVAASVVEEPAHLLWRGWAVRLSERNQVCDGVHLAGAYHLLIPCRPVAVAEDHCVVDAVSPGAPVHLRHDEVGDGAKDIMRQSPVAAGQRVRCVPQEFVAAPGARGVVRGHDGDHLGAPCPVTLNTTLGVEDVAGRLGVVEGRDDQSGLLGILLGVSAVVSPEVDPEAMCSQNVDEVLREMVELDRSVVVLDVDGDDPGRPHHRCQVMVVTDLLLDRPLLPGAQLAPLVAGAVVGHPDPDILPHLALDPSAERHGLGCLWLLLSGMSAAKEDDRNGHHEGGQRACCVLHRIRTPFPSGRSQQPIIIAQKAKIVNTNQYLLPMTKSLV